MIKGKYIVSQNGNVIGEFNNAITNEGMSIIRSYLANPGIEWCGAISIGSLNTTASANTNTSMDFEILKTPVLLRSIQNSEIVIKAALDADVECEIYELGLYPSVVNSTSNGYDDKLIVNFDELWYNSTTNVEINSSNFSSTSRAGSRSLTIPATSLDFSSDLFFDVSGYSSLDSMTFLYNVVSTGTDRIITIKLSDDQLPTPGTKSVDITIPGSITGYNKYSVLMGNFTELNNFNNRVSKISISSLSVPGSAVVNLDAIRIDDADEVDPNFSLVSRSLIGTTGGSTSNDFVKKQLGIEVDIEYRVEISSL